MIGLKVNGEFLDLYPGTTINIKFRSPLFAEDNIIPGSYSFPFNIPCGDVSPKNDRILDHPGEVTRHIRKKAYSDVYLYFDSNHLKKGNLIIDKVQNGIASGNLSFGLATISEELKTVLVKDIIAEEVVLTATTYTKKVQIKANTTGTLKLTVNGKDYEALSQSSLADAINANDEPPLAKATYYESGWYANDGKYVEIEPVSNPTDLETPLEVSQPNGNDPNDLTIIARDNVEGYMQEIADAVNLYLSDTPPDDKIRFPVVFNQAISPLWTPADPGEQRTRKLPDILLNNQNNDTTALLKINNYPNETIDVVNKTFYAANYTSLAPFLKLKHVIESIVSYFNISIEGDFLQTEDYNKALLYPATSLDSKQLYIGSKEFIFWKPSFNLSELVPQDLKAIDLLKALQTRYSLAIYFDEERKLLIINTREQILSDKTYTDITGLSSPIQSLAENYIEGIRLNSEMEKDDQYALLDVYSVGAKDELVINTPISGIQSTFDFPEVPQVNIPTPIKSLRFIFENGIVTESKTIGGRSTLTVVYYSATKDLPGYTNTFAGLYPAYWKNYVRWLMRRRKVQLECRLNFNEIFNLSWERKYRIGGVNYLINEVNVTLEQNGIYPADLELYTVD